jgi:very-short-patch-repair endonuclease
MPPELRALFAAQGGVATYSQILAHLSRRGLQRRLRGAELVKIFPGIYSLGAPDVFTRLCGLDLCCGEQVAVCLGTAAAIFGFDTEDVTDLHVLNPEGHNLRDHTGLKVHRRQGAPLTRYRGRPLTTPGWTAIEVARSLRRPRALATLDAALRSQTCDRRELLAAAEAQAGRRGIVAVRELIPLARPEAESPMESEARLVMLDGGLPEPALQYDIVDRDGLLWRVDFAWPDRRVAVEFDGFDWHSSREALRKDRQKRAALEEIDWRVMSIVSDDVRRQPDVMVRRIDAQLIRTVAA